MTLTLKTIETYEKFMDEMISGQFDVSLTSIGYTDLRDICTLAKRGLATMPKSLPELSLEGLSATSQKDFNVQMRLVAFEARLHRLELSRAFPDTELRSKRQAIETLEARIREIELRSTSDE